MKMVRPNICLCFANYPRNLASFCLVLNQNVFLSKISKCNSFKLTNTGCLKVLLYVQKTAI